ncbi:hypothetical protein [Photorhabdus laumondii]|nr:hypothetical protein [Photorhabdus laumondii]
MTMVWLWWKDKSDTTNKPRDDLKKNGISLDWINIVINTIHITMVKAPTD